MYSTHQIFTYYIVPCTQIYTHAYTQTHTYKHTTHTPDDPLPITLLQAPGEFSNPLVSSDRYPGGGLSTQQHCHDVNTHNDYLVGTAAMA